MWLLIYKTDVGLSVWSWQKKLKGYSLIDAHVSFLLQACQTATTLSFSLFSRLLSLFFVVLHIELGKRQTVGCKWCRRSDETTGKHNLNMNRSGLMSNAYVLPLLMNSYKMARRVCSAFLANYAVLQLFRKKKKCCPAIVSFSYAESYSWEEDLKRWLGKRNINLSSDSSRFLEKIMYK